MVGSECFLGNGMEREKGKQEEAVEEGSQVGVVIVVRGCSGRANAYV